MAISTFRRYERKFLVPEKKLNTVLSGISEYMVPDKYCKDGRYYTICNIYFDNECNDVIRHSTSKPYFKEKLRLRSYDTPESDDVTVYLELKKKMNKLVTKRRASLSLAQANDYIYNGIRPSTDKYINSQVLDEIDYFIATTAAVPKVYIAYDRRAFFHKDDKSIRLTVDFNIITRRYDLDLKKGIYGDRLLPDGVYLMEIKVSDNLPYELTRLLSENSVYPTSFSKYGKEFARYIQNTDKDVLI